MLNGAGRRVSEASRGGRVDSAGRLEALGVATSLAMPVRPLRGSSGRVRDGGLEALEVVEPAGGSGQAARGSGSG